MQLLFRQRRRFASIAQPAADVIRSRLGPDWTPKLGLVLGSGMGDVADTITDIKAVIPYSELPGFPVSSVEGHAGQLVCGSMGDLPVACYQGRVHMYEGGNPQDLRCPTYALKLIGCDALVVTSAVGSLRPEVGPGELVCVTDHINMQPASPLVGVNDEIGPRFTSMVDAYDPSLRAALHAAAERSTVKLHDGVFLATMGPMFETPAEIKAYRTLGADVVGMSCVVEMTVAKHCGLRAAAMTVVVNLAAGMTGDALDHEETLHFSAQAAGDVALVLREFAADPSAWK